MQLPCCSSGCIQFWLVQDSQRPGGQLSRRNGIQSTFWVHVRLLEDDVFVPACWEALILGAMIKPSVSALRPAAFSHLWVLSWSTSACFTRCGYLPWIAFDFHVDLSCWQPWCLALAFVIRVVLQAIPVPD